jgi:hypothetical protein
MEKMEVRGKIREVTVEIPRVKYIAKIIQWYMKQPRKNMARSLNKKVQLEGVTTFFILDNGANLRVRISLREPISTLEFPLLYQKVYFEMIKAVAEDMKEAKK